MKVSIELTSSDVAQAIKSYLSDKGYTAASLTFLDQNLTPIQGTPSATATVELQSKATGGGRQWDDR